jgi:hypothetical protein
MVRHIKKLNEMVGAFCFGIVILLLVLLAGAFPVIAHGTGAAIVEGEAVCAYFYYDDGDAMAYVKVTINAPGLEVHFQSGATDRNGIVCIVPDGDGDWIINANDGMGHMQKLTVPVVGGVQNMAALKQSISAGGSADRSGRIVIGLGILFGATGLLMWYQAQRRLKNILQPKGGVQKPTT